MPTCPLCAASVDSDEITTVTVDLDPLAGENGEIEVERCVYCLSDTCGLLDVEPARQDSASPGRVRVATDD